MRLLLLLLRVLGMLLNDYWTHGFVGRTGGTSENGLPRYRVLKI